MIGNLKSEGHLGRNYFAGRLGDPGTNLLAGQPWKTTLAVEPISSLASGTKAPPGLVTLGALSKVTTGLSGQVLKHHSLKGEWRASASSSKRLVNAKLCKARRKRTVDASAQIKSDISSNPETKYGSPSISTASRSQPRQTLRGSVARPVPLHFSSASFLVHNSRNLRSRHVDSKVEKIFCSRQLITSFESSRTLGIAL